MTALVPLSTRLSVEKPTLGTLSVHLEGSACSVGCEFCYLGARKDASPAPLALDLVTAALGELRYSELAVAVSSATPESAAQLSALVAAAAARGVPAALTTTAAVVKALPSLLTGVARLNLSVDPRKGRVTPERIETLAAGLRRQFPSLEVVLIVSLESPEFADRLIGGGLLARLVDLPSVHKVALNALKPPPDWCDRAFWMRALGKLGPLLARALDSRLFLDCYVAARLLRLGGCPARADLSPAATANGDGVAFRSCVYQPAPDFVAADVEMLARRLRGFVPPPACPFPIR
jgi:hypothetical protein